MRHTANIETRVSNTVKQRGVYANQCFQAGEIIEICPVVIIHGFPRDLPRELQTILFNWSNLTHSPPSLAIALGFGSLYNHNDPANLRYEVSIIDKTIRFISVVHIKTHDELTINYNSLVGDNTAKTNSWFDHYGIVAIKSG